MFFTHDLTIKASKIIDMASEARLRICFAESCTGGLFSSLFTEIPGSAKAFDRSLVTYSIDAKVELLGIERAFIDKYGVVSTQVADAMARNVVSSLDAVSIGITGIAGSNTGVEKDRGLVYISSFNVRSKNIISKRFVLPGNRDDVRRMALIEGMAILEENIKIN